MSELRDRLERLAARGTRRGADDVLGAAQQQAPRGEISVVPEFDGPDLPRADDDVLPIVTADPEARRRGRFGTVVAAFGIAALLGVGMLAVTAVFGNGGASSPEGAVRQLADAVSHKDPLAAVDVLSPTEVRAARQTVDDAIQRAADLKIVDKASQPLAGVDLSVDHLALETQTLADGYAKVTVTGGEISASTHTAAMSKLLQDAIKDDGNAPGKVDLARLASDSNLPTFVVTVRRDGRWYVSPAYTALEYAREADGGPAADFGSANAKVAELGSDTPENAVSDALHAWQASNWDRLLALAPPDELPVYDYRNWINQAAADTHPDFTIDTLTTSSSVSGDTATVKLEASGTTGSGSDQAKWQVGGTCADDTFGSGWASSAESPSSALVPGEDVKQIGENGGGPYSDSSGSVEESFTSSWCVSGDLGHAVPAGFFALGSESPTPSSGSVSIQVVRENGRWFVSPVTTALAALDSAIRSVDERTVYSVLGLAYRLPPDGAITLGQPFAPKSQTSLFGASVYEFEGTKGRQVVGEITGSRDYMFASGRLYTADGEDVDYVEFSTTKNGYAYPVTLPTTGSYRLVVNGPVSKDAKLTLWDTKDAPTGLIGSGGEGFTSVGSSEACERTATGVSCSFSESPTPLGENSGPTETTSPATPAPRVGVATTVP